MADRRPNVLFITADQWRGDALGVAGQGWLQTPNLDRLAGEGYYFPRCYSECPVCVAARIVWLTGQHPWTTGSRTNKQVPVDATTTAPGVLTAAGYRTRGIGKMHYGPPDAWQTRGFEKTVIVESGRTPEPDDFHQFLAGTPYAGLSRGHGVGNNDVFAAVSPLPEPYTSSAWVSAVSSEFVERHAALEPDVPFMLYTSFSRPHSPYDPPRPYDSLYQVWDVPRPYRRPGDFSEGPPRFEQQALHYTWQTLGEEQILVSRCHYYGQITHIDHCLGRLFGTLQRLGLWDNTVICFNADHGDLMGDHNLFFKANFYEESTHVPLILYVPEPLRRRLDLPEPGVVDTLCGVMDVAPTLLDAVGVERPGTMESAGLLPLVRGAEGAPVDGVYGYDQDLNLMYRERDWKYNYWTDGRFEQLFCTATDPAELHNLAADPAHAGRKAALRQALIARLRQRHATEALAGDDLAGYDHDPARSRWQPIKGPWGRRPY